MGIGEVVFQKTPVSKRGHQLCDVVVDHNCSSPGGNGRVQSSSDFDGLILDHVSSNSVPPTRGPQKQHPLDS